MEKFFINFLAVSIGAGVLASALILGQYLSKDGLAIGADVYCWMDVLQQKKVLWQQANTVHLLKQLPFLALGVFFGGLVTGYLSGIAKPAYTMLLGYLFIVYLTIEWIFTPEFPFWFLLLAGLFSFVFIWFANLLVKKWWMKSQL